MKNQEEHQLPYESIPETADSYTAGTVISRIIDGLGFRFYWATLDLSQKDLEFRPVSDARSIYETINHIYNLLLQVKGGLDNNRYSMPEPEYEWSIDDFRHKTLTLIKELSDQVSAMNNNDFNQTKMLYKIGGKDMDFPFWFGLNGPLTDAIYHIGQITNLRRASGNPIDQGINVFLGKKMPQ